MEMAFMTSETVGLCTAELCMFLKYGYLTVNAPTGKCNTSRLILKNSKLLQTAQYAN